MINHSVPPKVKAALQPEADETYVMNTQFMGIKGDISIVNFYESEPDGYPAIPGLGGIVSSLELEFKICVPAMSNFFLGLGCQARIRSIRVRDIREHASSM